MAKLDSYEGGNEDSVEKVEKFLKRNFRRVVFAGAMGLLGLVGACQSVYTISADSQGVVRRFGAYARTTEPGIHIKIPYLIEKVKKVPTTLVQKEEFGFRTIKSGIKSEIIGADNIMEENKDEKELREEYLMLTGDLNMANIEFVVQYRINDPVKYLFNIRDSKETIRDCGLAVMRQVIGDGSVDEAITIGRIENEQKVTQGLQKLLDEYDFGIKVVTVKLQSCNPPRRVQPSFNEVNKAMQEKEQKINQARQEYNTVIPKAKGEAEQMIKTAEGQAIERVNRAKGDVAKFEKMLAEYSKAPEITRTRLYLETMEKVLPGLETTIIEQKGAEGGVLQLLKLNEEYNRGERK